MDGFGQTVRSITPGGLGNYQTRTIRCSPHHHAPARGRR